MEPGCYRCTIEGSDDAIYINLDGEKRKVFCFELVYRSAGEEANLPPSIKTLPELRINIGSNLAPEELALTSCVPIYVVHKWFFLSCELTFRTGMTGVYCIDTSVDANGDIDAVDKESFPIYSYRFTNEALDYSAVCQLDQQFELFAFRSSIAKAIHDALKVSKGHGYTLTTSVTINRAVFKHLCALDGASVSTDVNEKCISILNLSDNMSARKDIITQRFKKVSFRKLDQLQSFLGTNFYWWPELHLAFDGGPFPANSSRAIIIVSDGFRNVGAALTFALEIGTSLLTIKAFMEREAVINHDRHEVSTQHFQRVKERLEGLCFYDAVEEESLQVVDVQLNETDHKDKTGKAIMVAVAYAVDVGEMKRMLCPFEHAQEDCRTKVWWRKKHCVEYRADDINLDTAMVNYTDEELAQAAHKRERRKSGKRTKSSNEEEEEAEVLPKKKNRSIKSAGDEEVVVYDV